MVGEHRFLQMNSNSTISTLLTGQPVPGILSMSPHESIEEVDEYWVGCHLSVIIKWHINYMWGLSTYGKSVLRPPADTENHGLGNL